MKKTSKAKLVLMRDTIRILESGLARVAGGIVTTSGTCTCPTNYCTNGCNFTDECTTSQSTKPANGCDGSIVR